MTMAIETIVSDLTQLWHHNLLLIEAKTSVSSPSIENKEHEASIRIHLSLQQKIVIKVQIKCDKCRSKAMKLVAATGVDSVAIEGEDKDHLVIVGDDIDPANLTCILRKKVGHANILKVEKAKKHKLESVVHLYPNYPQCSQVVLYDSESCSSNTNACSIL
ncbi:unnamed protein product [Musa acuminata subsp. malaccensis]|uniref:(wild Malaysian banana) hypothetical protein n=1 Tax=Musa acuminata subsp. malaccensis TaxID=214687 RepID=A0A804KPQ6_MUSAM|nr:PREDICTED: uncharacterized protein LOC103999434 [Musa acuminata subsp. malaccensis]CAG1836760.1 unnamed protein product [Musa acuminata subsp. malaccensis]